MTAGVTSHWNGDYLYESENRLAGGGRVGRLSPLSMYRPDDGAVIHAITTFGEVGFPPHLIPTIPRFSPATPSLTSTPPSPSDNSPPLPYPLPPPGERLPTKLRGGRRHHFLPRAGILQVTPT